MVAYHKCHVGLPQTCLPTTNMFAYHKQTWQTAAVSLMPAAAAQFCT